MNDKVNTKAYYFLLKLLSNIKIPEGKILYVHIKLRKLQYIVDCSYKDLVLPIVESLQLLFNPITILVPTFTYTFTKNGIFHRLFSMSEVGRFSEEIRQEYINYRTPDPIFSVIDVNNYLFKEKIDINYQVAFGKNCLFDYLNKENCIFINIGLDELIATQLHYIEKINNVSYRYDKVFRGVIYYNKNTYRNIGYKYYVRDLKSNLKWNRAKIEQCLAKEGALYLFIRNGIRVLWFSAHNSVEVLSKYLKKDDTYLTT